MDKAFRLTPLAGRILIAAIFVLSGLSKIGNWNQTAGYMASRDMIAVPLFLVAAILIEVFGGMALIAGFKARYAAVALTGFLVVTTLVFHPFWSFHGQEQQLQMINFLKNLSIVGGLLYVASFNSGPVSVDAYLERARSSHASKPLAGTAG
jgi:putative oxidoreductase